MISQTCDGPDCGRPIGVMETLIKAHVQVTGPTTPWGPRAPLEDLSLDFCSWTCAEEYVNPRAAMEGLPKTRGTRGDVRTTRTVMWAPGTETGELVKAEDVLP